MEIVGFLGYKIKLLLYFLGLLLGKKKEGRIVRASYIATMNKGMGEFFLGQGWPRSPLLPLMLDVIYESAVW